uniref:Uncharacterized protein n=1 Tax=Tetraselmis sp. GSL018 TaxID=582737 RepID=A0A061QLG4_9CHLO
MEESRENFSELTSRPPVLNRTLSNFYDIALAKVHTLSWLKSRKKQGHGSAALDAVPEETKREIAAWWEALTKKKGAELRVRHVLEVWNEQSGRRLTREQRAALTKWCKGGSEEAMIDFPAFRGLCLDLMELGYASQSASFKLSHTRPGLRGPEAVSGRVGDPRGGLRREGDRVAGCL